MNQETLPNELNSTNRVNQTTDDDDANTCNFDEEEIGKVNTMKKADKPTSTTLQTLSNQDGETQSQATTHHMRDSRYVPNDPQIYTIQESPEGRFSKVDDSATKPNVG